MAEVTKTAPKGTGAEEWPVENWYTKGVLNFLQKGDAVMLRIKKETKENVLVKDLQNKYIVFLNTKGDEIELPRLAYGDAWRLAPPKTNLLTFPLKEASFCEALHRLEDICLDEADEQELAELLACELLENVIFSDGDICNEAMHDVTREYLHKFLTEEAVDILKENQHDIWNMSADDKKKIWEEIKNFTESQKNIFCFVVGITNPGKTEYIHNETMPKLSFRYLDVTLWREQKALLKDAGYFVYDLRDHDEGNGYTIETFSRVNNIGNWVTDIDLTPYMDEGSWIDRADLDDIANIALLPYDEIKELLRIGRECHIEKKCDKSVIFAKIKNGGLLKVVRKEDDWYFILATMDGKILEKGYTAYRDLSMYPEIDEIKYILTYCLDMPNKEYLIL